MKFKNIYTNALSRVNECLLSLWTPGDHPMRPAVSELLKREPFIGEPYFQSAFGWKQIGPNINWKSGFETDVADMIERFGTDGGNRPWWKPYVHQHESWQILNDTTPGNAQSIVVTSGTGSGKTECFLYPVLNDLYRNHGEGVQAIFMYPLNALANDQKGRIRKCCEELGLQFACYNGNTKYAGAYNANTPEIEFRTAIREHRPDLLMTNPSMLEYIMVRAADQVIMKPNNPNRQTSPLRWIIIDEAHTFTGSAAAELKYEIARVVEAFGARMEDIHFACTSATIGSNQADLINFIHELTGQDAARIHVIGGERACPSVPSSNAIQTELDNRGITVSASNVLTLRRQINDNPYLSASQVWEILFPGQVFKEEFTAGLLEILDGLCEISWPGGQGTPTFLMMLRAHFFMREPNGIFACLNPACQHHSDSPFGFITGIDSLTCPHCGAPLFELVQCRSCQEFMLKAKEDSSHEIRAVRESYDTELDNIFLDDEDDDTTSALGGAQDEYLAGLTSTRKSFRQLGAFFHNVDFSSSKPQKTRATSANGQYVSYKNDSQSECCTHCGHVATSRTISGFHLSANTLKLLVTPALLSETTPNPGQFWGKYISFTDSRQKTAVSAKRFNISVERDLAIAKILAKLTRERINNNGICAPVRIKDFTDIIDPNLFEHMDTSSTELESYKAAVLRSVIGRRLLNAAGSLETMGLMSVVYPSINEKPLPQVIVNWNNNNPGKTVSKEDWHDFLKICVDYIVRLSNCIQPLNRSEVQHEKDYLRNNSPSFICWDKATINDRRGKQWPRINKTSRGVVIDNQHRIITLICAAFGIDDATQLAVTANENLVNNILYAAWEQLTENDGNGSILSTDDHCLHYYLDISAKPLNDNEQCKLKLNETSRLCPVSRKFLDVTFMGYSPMIHGELSRDNMDQYKCVSGSIRMPMLVLRQPTDAQIKDWMEHDADVANLKTLGLWSNYMENAFRFRNAFIAAEHSAQLDRGDLERYTAQFKGTEPGQLNVLNCSTTMEMGVDIGDIDMVYMANVPPEASNYLQRAGRAGRFGQSKAVAFTSCPNTPDGLETFFSPSVMLEDRTAKKMPVESSVIVDRHVNSFFFRDFLTSGGMDLDGQSSATDFFEEIQAGGITLYDEFIRHLNGIGNRLDTQFARLFPGINDIVAARARTIGKISQIRANFHRTYSDLVNEYNNAANQAAKTAISYQLARIGEQNLIGFLSEKQFFPNASMPTGIVEFDASTRDQKRRYVSLKQELKALRQQLKTAHPGNITTIQENISNKEGELRHIKKSTIVSREDKVALNEYAPGQTVVVKEKNFLSCSLMNRNQFGAMSARKFLSKCDTCGWTEYSDTIPNNGGAPIVCSHCGGLMESVGLYDGGSSQFTEVRATVGYATNYNRDEDRREENIRRFFHISTVLPQFSWNGGRAAGFCDVVGKEEATIVHCNHGDGFGFAVMRPQPNGLNTTAVLDVPYTAKPNIESTNSWRRDRNTNVYSSAEVYRHVILSCENTTSYAALRFFDDVNHNTPLVSRGFLYSMGMVLARTLCDHLNIDHNEVGFEVNKSDDSYFVFIYDTNKGGAGYSNRLMDPAVFESVVRKAYDRVSGFTCDCKDNPGHACSKCLLTKGSYEYASLLSTYDVYEWLKKQMRVFKAVPDNIRNLSPSCRREPRLLQEILEGAVKDVAVRKIELFIPKENELIASDWTDQSGTMRNLLDEARKNGKTVELYLEYDPNDNDLATQHIIYHTATALGWMGTVKAAEFTGDVRSAVVLTDAAGNTLNFFTDEFDSIPLSNSWGTDCDSLYQDNGYPQMRPLRVPTQNDIQALMAGGNRHVVEGSIADGIYSTDSIYRDILLHQVIGNDQQMIDGIGSILSGKAVQVQFTENYLLTPLSCIILTGLIKEMRDTFGLIITDITLNLDYCLCINNHYPMDEQYIRFNFASNPERDKFVKELMQNELGVNPVIGVNHSDHHRWLRFTDPSGSYVEIRPDHGIGACWKNDNYKHKNLVSLYPPIRFSKHIKYNEPEPSIIYYVIYDKK